MLVWIYWNLRKECVNTNCCASVSCLFVNLYYVTLELGIKISVYVIKLCVQDGKLACAEWSSWCMYSGPYWQAPLSESSAADRAAGLFPVMPICTHDVWWCEIGPVVFFHRISCVDTIMAEAIVKFAESFHCELIFDLPKFWLEMWFTSDPSPVSRKVRFWKFVTTFG